MSKINLVRFYKKHLNKLSFIPFPPTWGASVLTFDDGSSLTGGDGRLLGGGEDDGGVAGHPGLTDQGSHLFARVLLHTHSWTACT